MSEKKKLFIHGGSSLISKYLIKKLYLEFDEIHIFCRNIEKTLLVLDLKSEDQKLLFYENDLNNLNQTLSDINKLPNDLTGILWVTGHTGDPDLEFDNSDLAKKNLNVNFVNVVISITQLISKVLKNKNSFICVITSVAGLRGRNKRLFYSAGKGGLINFLSGLRQRLQSQIKILTVIPGYISTNSFKENAPKFLITSSEKASEIIIDGIKKNKDIIYINKIWRIIMLVISLIPEKIYKKLSF